MDNTFDLYKDIQTRTNGEIFVGVVGPVRCGKSTFIKRFMEICVLPNIQDEYAKKQAMDELPQSSAGKTIMTTEPKFIPAKACEITFQNEQKAKVRCIDCVGYMVEGAMGHMEGEKERLVKTPWFEEEIPFVKAAEIGTEKVIREHSTVGIVMTCDGSFSNLEPSSYEAPLKKTIFQLKQIGKPFIVVLNTQKPYSEETIALSNRIASEYGVHVIAMNVMQMKKDDIDRIMQCILEEFSLTQILIETPGWLSMLNDEHPVKLQLRKLIKDNFSNLRTIRDMKEKEFSFDESLIVKSNIEKIDLATGTICMQIKLREDCYYELLTNLLGKEVLSEYDLYIYLKEIAAMRSEYEKVQTAMESVRQKGYGVITPGRDEISLSQPEVIHHGNKYGVKLQAVSPSIHLIKANIETEIAPIVGTKQQAEDLIAYIEKDAGNHNRSAEENQECLHTKENAQSIWETSIFGKTVEQMVQDGINAKVSMIGDESQIKLQDTMQKIVNDTNGGLVCIIL